MSWREVLLKPAKDRKLRNMTAAALALLSAPFGYLIDGPKGAIGSATMAFSFIGLSVYIFECIWDEAKPHPYSWFVWTVADMVAWFDQWKNHSGPGSWPTLIMGILTLVTWGISVYQVKVKKVVHVTSWLDKSTLWVGLATIPILVIEQNIPASMIGWAAGGIVTISLATLIDAAAFVPTIKKALTDPGSEPSAVYNMNVVRHGITTLAIRSYNPVTLMFPLASIALNAIAVFFIWLGKARAKNQERLRPQEG